MRPVEMKRRQGWLVGDCLPDKLGASLRNFSQRNTVKSGCELQMRLPIVRETNLGGSCMDVNRSGKRSSAAMLCIGLGILAVLMSYVFVQAVHHVEPNAQPHAPLPDRK